MDFEVGYDAECDLLEIYLIIDNHFNRKYKNNLKRLM